MRALRDRSDLFEDGGNVIVGRATASASIPRRSTSPVVPRGDHLAVHLTGTDFMEPLHEPALDELRPYWAVALESESPTLYRGEYLAGQLLQDAAAGHGLSTDALQRAALDSDALGKLVRTYAAPRYRDGYEKGIHDFDAAKLLQLLLSLRARRRPADPSSGLARWRCRTGLRWRRLRARVA